jgi:hypothetical protein
MYRATPSFCTSAIDAAVGPKLLWSKKCAASACVSAGAVVAAKATAGTPATMVNALRDKARRTARDAPARLIKDARIMKLSLLTMDKHGTFESSQAVCATRNDERG